MGKDAIWIDGLCIDQEDPDDKRVQVNQMSTVHKHAETVMTILNSPTDESDFLLDRQNWMSEIISTQHSRMHKTMLTILANDYWRRTWILQEIVLARKIMFCCGKRLLSFEEISSLFSRLTSNQSLGQFATGLVRSLKIFMKTSVVSDSTSHDEADGGNFDHRDLAILSSKGRANYQDIALLDLLDKLRRWNRCFDPKDMLYARKGLAMDGTILIPDNDVNYTKTQSVEDVYRRFAMRCVTTPSSACLRILTYAVWYSEGKLPSWVPDWRVPASSWQAAFKE